MAEILTQSLPRLAQVQELQHGLWETVLEQLDDVAQRLNLDPCTHAVLRQPERELKVSIPVVLDDNSVQVFTGYRVQHSSARGPCKGGIRYHPDKRRGRRGQLFRVGPRSAMFLLGGDLQPKRNCASWRAHQAFCSSRIDYSRLYGRVGISGWP